MKRKTGRLAALILVIALLLAPAVSAAESGQDMYDKLETVAGLITQYNVNSSDGDDPLKNALIDLMQENPAVFEKLMGSMLSHYDRYSNYVAPGLYDTYYPKAEKYVGIGISMDAERLGGIFVESVLSGSPAEGAGILPGDELISVSGKDVRALTISQISPLVRGEEGSSVTIGVRRPYTEKPLYFSVKRKGLYVSNVTFTDMGDGVMYIKIARFGDLKTFTDFVSRYKKLPYEGYRSVIIDVRGNPGGDLSVLANMLNYVVPDKNKTMFALRYRDMKIETIDSNGLGWRPNKLVLLADEHSASASEVFVGSLQDLGYGEIVGTTTYGKGYGQYHIPLEDTSTAIISNFELWLPVTIKYDGIGIKPKYNVALKQIAYPMPRLLPLYPTGAVTASESYSERAEALEQRLSLLGYLGKTVDGIFDSETLWAVNAFQRTHGLTQTADCPVSTLTAIDKDIATLAGTLVTKDTQLDKALELARAAAEKPLSYVPPKVDLD